MQQAPQQQQLSQPQGFSGVNLAEHDRVVREKDGMIQQLETRHQELRTK